MRQLIITQSGGPDVLTIQEKPEPSLESNEVRVAVKACGLNFADVLARQGLYPDAPPTPCCMGYEFAGEITELGENVDTAWAGKSVFGLSRFNGQADQVCVPIDQVFEKPESLSFEQAAAIPVNYLTAWQLLVVMGNLQAEDSVLIHNAGGGVGLAALEIARHIGAFTLGTASEGKHAFLKDRGLDVAIDYRHGNWETAVMEATSGRGVELITDPLGGNNWRCSFRVLRDTGRLGMFGVSEASASGIKGKIRLLKVAAQMPFFHPVKLMNQNKAVFGVNMGHLWHETGKIRQWMEALLSGVSEGWIKPHVDTTFELEEADKAHRYLENRKNRGKVILLP